MIFEKPGRGGGGGGPTLTFLACNPHRDRALDVRHSQLELLFSFSVCNPHRDRALDVRHSQLELLHVLQVLV